MIRTISALALLGMSLTVMAPAFAEDDELVRLPGQGELREPQRANKDRPQRLKPGGGLFISFDVDANGIISAAEIESGIPLAFSAADQNGDGFLTALEQRDWAGALPTRDDSLANPVRFDPNLDRRVSLEEFDTVITGLGLEYADEQTGEIKVADLKAPNLRRKRGKDDLENDRYARQEQRSRRRAQ